MTYLKPILFAAAASLAFASPAFAGPQMHDGDMNKDAMHDSMTHSAMSHDDMKAMKKAHMKKWTEDSGLTKAEWKKQWKEKHAASDMKMHDATAMTKTNTEVRGAVETRDDLGQILQSNETNVPRMTGDDKLLMSEGQIKTEAQLNSEEQMSTAMDNAITVPTVSNPNKITTVSCPVGTTAQADMTCLVTGDWSPRS